MYYDTARLDWKRSYKLLAATVVPRPIAWVVTLAADGTANAAPFSFFNYFSGDPPVVCLGMSDRPSGPPDTFVHVQRSGELVINLVPETLAEAMNVTAIEFPPGVDELAQAGLRTLPSRQVAPPRIVGSPVALECRLHQVLDVMDGHARLLVCRVVAIHIDDAALIDAERCHVDTARLGLIGRLDSPGGYLRTTDRFVMRTPSVQAWAARQPDGVPPPLPPHSPPQSPSPSAATPSGDPR